jgi:hypothetical protein
MTITTIYKVGDRVQAGDGRIGTVIHTDLDPVRQSAISPQTVVVKFPDLSTLEGPAEKFKRC